MRCAPMFCQTEGRGVLLGLTDNVVLNPGVMTSDLIHIFPGHFPNGPTGLQQTVGFPPQCENAFKMFTDRRLVLRRSDD